MEDTERILKAVIQHKFDKAERLAHYSLQPNQVPSIRVADIFQARPRILKGLTDEQMEPLRIACAMGLLTGEPQWSQWLPTDLELGLKMDNEAGARMILFYLSIKGNLESYKEMGVKTVKVLSAGDSRTCDVCRMIQNRVYAIGKVPELPFEDCTSQIGCRCNVEFEDPD